MKKLLITLSIALQTIISTAQITVNVPTAGGFSTALTAAGGDPNTVTNLIVTGNIDFRDIFYMRVFMPVLAVVDLEAVQIKALGDNLPANEMPYSAFIGKISLTSIKLPESITSIGGEAFSGCSGLSGKLVIPNSVTKIGAFAFYNCDGFTGELIIPNSVTYIQNQAFGSCSGFTGNLILPNSLTYIDQGAFEFCPGFTGLSIPSSVSTIIWGAFAQCIGLQKIIVEREIPVESSSDPFNGVNKTNCELIVPFGSKAAYQAANFWKDFINISETIFVTFNTQGGSAIVDTLVNYNSKISPPPDPIKAGCTFLGWYKEAACINAWNFETDLVTTNTNLYAKWTLLPPITVNVPTSGGFSAALIAAGGDEFFVDSLIVTGNIDARDIKFIRDKMPRLAVLDLTNVVIAAYTGTGGTSGNLNSTFYPANELPQFSFCVQYTYVPKTSLTSVKLPNSLTSVGAWAFTDCSGLSGNLSIPNSVTSIKSHAFYRCTGFIGDLTIPNSVTSIEDNAFYCCTGFTGSLNISNSVTNIGKYAFYGCSGLTGALNFPSSLTSIGNYAFYACSGFTSNLNIPGSVASIGKYAFYGCSGFGGSLNIPNTITIIEDYAFYGCSGFSGNLNIPNSVTSVGEGAFQGCSGFSGDLVIPGAVVSVGIIAFLNCSGFTGNLVLPSTLNSVGLGAFANCSGFTGNLTIPKSVTDLGAWSFYNCSGFTGDLIVPSSVALIRDHTFNSCSGFNGKLIIPNSVTSLENMIFFGCSGLTALTIPSSVSSISNMAFKGFTSLEKITVAQSVPLTIYENTFLGVNKTTCELTVPAGSKAAYQAANYWKDFVNISEAIFVTFNTQGGGTIADTIVNYNTNLVNPGAPPWGGTPFLGWYKEANCINAWNFETDLVTTNITLYAKWGILTVNVPQAGGFSAALLAAGGDASVLRSLIVTGNIDTRDIKFMRDSIPMLAMLDLTDVVIDAYTGTGGTSGNLYSTFYPANEMPQFSFCVQYTYFPKTSLKSVKLPSSITSVGAWAFTDCSGLSGNLSIPASVTSIKSHAFYRCTGFTGDLTIPNSVTSIEDNAFYCCTGFTGSLNISNSLTNIGKYAFYGCSGLKGALNFPGSLSSIGNYAFYACNGFTGNLNIPGSVASIGKYAFYGCSGFGGSLNIPNAITIIEDYAFYGCSGFSGNLNIPNSVTSVGEGAFQGCSGFSGDLVIPGAVVSIGTIAFGNCSGFNGNLVLPNTLTSVGLGAFANCSGFSGNLTIPKSVTDLGAWAFYNCSGFTGDIIIPNSVALIRDHAFNSCSGFNGKLIIPNSVISIENMIFFGCSGLTALTIPRSVSSISNMAFKGFNSLEKITVAQSVPLTIYENTFLGVNKTTCELTVPAGSKAAYQAANYWKDFLNISEAIFVTFNTQGGRAIADTIVNYNTNLVNPGAPTRGGWIFLGWYKEIDCINEWNFETDLVTTNTTLYAKWGDLIVNVPQAGGFSAAIIAAGGDASTVTNLIVTGNIDARDIKFMRDSMPALANLDLADVVIVAYTGTGGTDWNQRNTNFYPANEMPYCSFISNGIGKKSLISIELPNSITSIGKVAFEDCSGLSGNLIIPNSVTSIGDVAFSGCSGFTGTLNFPGSLNSIGEGTFYGCSGFTGTLNFPGSVNSIGGDAFYGCNGFTGNLNIPGSVASIGQYVFYGCSGFSGNLNIPGSVSSIGQNAFYGCSRFTGNLNIPGSVASIGEYAFYGCSGFSGSLNIPNSISIIEDYTFYGCSGFIDLTIPNSVSIIEDHSFDNCIGLQKIKVVRAIPPTIYENTFLGVNKTTCELIVPIGSKAAYQAANYWKDFFNISEAIFVTFNTQGGNTIADTIVNYNTKIVAPNTPIRPNSTFLGWYKETSCINAWNFDTDVVTTNTTLYAKWGDLIVNVPEASGFSAALIAAGGYKSTVSILIVTGTIDARDIKFMRDSLPFLAELDLLGVSISSYTGTGGTIRDQSSHFYPANEMPEQSFSGKHSLISIKLPNTLTSIGAWAFHYCWNLLGNFVIPNSVTVIGSHAFEYCGGFTGNLIIPNSVTSIGDSAFFNCGFIGNLIIPNSVTSIGNSAFTSSEGFTGDLIIPNSVTSIGDDAFSNCIGFTGNLIIPNSVTSIGDDAFSNCFGFTGNLIIPNSVTSIGEGTFYNCWGFTGDLIIPNSVTFIGDDAFYFCKGFTSNLIIPNSVASIGSNAFSGCIGFTGDLIIPNSVASIGSGAFYFCKGFTGNLIISNSVTAIEAWAFLECSGFKGDLIIPNSVTSIGDAAFSGCSGFTGNLVLSNSVTYIGNGAFLGCSGLSGNLIIPESITTIEQNAFSYCSGFTGDLIIPNSVTSIEQLVFGGCSGFTGNLIIPGSVTAIGEAAFWDCSGFIGLTIPASVSLIENGAFSNCIGLQKISADKAIPPTIYESTFEGVDKITCELVVPPGSKAAYQTADYWKDFFIISEGLKVAYNLQSGSTIADTVVYYNSCITAPTVKGYSIDTWYKETNCINKWNFAADLVTTNTELYAKWPNSIGTVPEPNNMKLSLYPNPAGDFIKIQREGLNSVIIYNSLGVAQLQCKPNNEESVTINIGNLNPGIYIALIKTSEGKINRMKFVKK